MEQFPLRKEGIEGFLAKPQIELSKLHMIVSRGGLANCPKLVDRITKRVKFIAHVKLYPGENEMLALAQGSLRVLSGTESVKHYSPPG